MDITKFFKGIDTESNKKGVDTDSNKNNNKNTLLFKLGQYQEEPKDSCCEKEKSCKSKEEIKEDSSKD